jgi:hypothetical protein
MFPVEAFQRTIEKFVQIASSIDLPFHLTGGLTMMRTKACNPTELCGSRLEHPNPLICAMHLSQVSPTTMQAFAKLLWIQ